MLNTIRFYQAEPVLAKRRIRLEKKELCWREIVQLKEDDLPGISILIANLFIHFRIS